MVQPNRRMVKVVFILFRGDSKPVSLFSIYRMETKTNDHTKKQQDCLSDGNIRSKKKRLRHKSFLLSSSLFIFYLFYLFVLLEFEGRVYQGQFCHVLKPLNTRKIKIKKGFGTHCRSKLRQPGSTPVTFLCDIWMKESGPKSSQSEP